MTSQVDLHRAALRSRLDWTDYLAANSGLPGPRGNLELVAACGEEADLQRAVALIATGDEFSTVCGLVALGRHFGLGDDTHVGVLHDLASDHRWRVREGVAMAVQRASDADLARGFELAERWARDVDPLVRRAAVAAVCEPRLLRTAAFAERALTLLDLVTADLTRLPSDGRRAPAVRTLRQALGYGWSVAIAARPRQGLARFDRLRASNDPDVAWIVRENLKKARLRRLIAPPEIDG